MNSLTQIEKMEKDLAQTMAQFVATAINQKGKTTPSDVEANVRKDESSMVVYLTEHGREIMFEIRIETKMVRESQRIHPMGVRP